MRPADRLIVRQARDADVESIIAFSRAMALETEGRMLDEGRLREGTRSLLDSPAHGFFMVAEASHTDPPRLVGQLMITFEWSDWRNATFWWIQSVYVDPKWRRQGVFKRLHQTVLQQARGRTDVCGLRLYVDKDNPVARATYERIGLIRSPYQIYEVDFVLPLKTPKESR
jgi:GNAT superfamily N-acetyltransferase